MDAVHANGSFTFLQFLAIGRIAESDILRKEESYSVVGPSAVPLEDHEMSCALTVEETKEYVQLYATAAENAVLKAGIDGVEIHLAGAYIPVQSIKTASN